MDLNNLFPAIQIKQSIHGHSKAPVAMTSIDLHQSLSELLFLQELNRYQQAFIDRIFMAYPKPGNIPSNLGRADPSKPQDEQSPPLGPLIKDPNQETIDPDLEYRLQCIRHQETHYRETIELLERRIENAINLVRLSGLSTRMISEWTSSSSMSRPLTRRAVLIDLLTSLSLLLPSLSPR